jgi:hypothetical protein
MTDDEHHARAALMGMKYHNDNGGDCPFYYKLGADGIPDWLTFIDPVTLEPLIMVEQDDVHDSLRYKASPKARKSLDSGSFWPPIE